MNWLVHGDCLEVMGELAGGVRLAYLDPPFNTGERFADFHDAMDRRAWLSAMKPRLLAAWRLLREDGSLWVHCDDAEQAALRVLLDDALGRDAFVATVVWQRRYSRENRRAFSTAHDYCMSTRRRRASSTTATGWRAMTAGHVARRRRPARAVVDGLPGRAGRARDALAVLRDRAAVGARWSAGRLLLAGHARALRGARRGRARGAGRAATTCRGARSSGPTRRASSLHVVDARGGRHNAEASAEQRRLFPGARPFSTPKPSG